jgi:hypothetical protein
MLLRAMPRRGSRRSRLFIARHYFDAVHDATPA